MMKEFVEENRRKSRFKPMGKRSNDCVARGRRGNDRAAMDTECAMTRKPLAIGRFSKALLIDDRGKDGLPKMAHGAQVGEATVLMRLFLMH